MASKLTEQLKKREPAVLHIANWYPNPWNKAEGNFVRDHIRLSLNEVSGKAIVVQVRQDDSHWLKLRRIDLGNDVRGYFLLSKARTGGAVSGFLTTFLLLAVLIRQKAWRYSALHVHIAIPLLIHVHLWHRLLGRPIIIFEHWSAYHYDFNLPKDSGALKRLRRPFTLKFPTVAVSEALIDDIRRFSGAQFPGFVLPNCVPLHGATSRNAVVPTLFSVNIWRSIKDPIPMLQGLALAAEGGIDFDLVIGGFGQLEAEMRDFVSTSALASRTRFLGYMTKAEIAGQLAVSDGYIFTSRYETFSVACAEALGAGVPLVGPHLDAIAEYAGADDWVQVQGREPEHWQNAVKAFLARLASGSFDREAIARRASDRFSPAALASRYRAIIAQVLSEV